MMSCSCVALLVYNDFITQTANTNQIILFNDVSFPIVNTSYPQGNYISESVFFAEIDKHFLTVLTSIECTDLGPHCNLSLVTIQVQYVSEFSQFN